jgi:hypothetical protein
MKNEVKVVKNKIIIIYSGTYAIRTIDNIRFCNSSHNNSVLNFKTGKPLIAPVGLSKLALLLPEEAFCKIHKRYLVHYAIMQEAIIKDGKIIYRKHVLPITRECIAKFRCNAEAYHTSEKNE